jgi:hypothetical protein
MAHTPRGSTKCDINDIGMRGVNKATGQSKMIVVQNITVILSAKMSATSSSSREGYASMLHGSRKHFWEKWPNTTSQVNINSQEYVLLSFTFLDTLSFSL